MPGSSIALNQFDGLGYRVWALPDQSPLFAQMNRWDIPTAFSSTNYALSGLGSTLPQTINTANQIGQGAAGVATAQTPAGVVQSAGTIAAGAVGAASIAGVGWATAAIPFVGPIVAGVTVGLSLLFGRKGPKQKVATTQVVNDVEPKLVENLNGYLNGPRTQSSQAQAIQNFYAGWNYVLTHCPTPENGNPGQNCVNERKEGATPSWGPDWFQLYLDPIRNDTQVVPDPIVDTSAIGGALTTIGVTPGADGSLVSGSVAGVPVALLGAGLLILFALTRRSN